MNTDEIGKELSVSVLRQKFAVRDRFVVVARRVDKPTAVTLWLTHIDEEMATLEAASLNPVIILGLFVRGEELHDDSGQKVEIREYLGEQ